MGNRSGGAFLELLGFFGQTVQGVDFFPASGQPGDALLEVLDRALEQIEQRRGYRSALLAVIPEHEFQGPSRDGDGFNARHAGAASQRVKRPVDGVFWRGGMCGRGFQELLEDGYMFLGLGLEDLQQILIHFLE